MKRLASLAMLATLFGALFLPLQTANAGIFGEVPDVCAENYAYYVEELGYEFVDLNQLGVTAYEAGSGSQLIAGTPEDDWIDAGPGHDFVCGGEGDDEIYGSSGNDILYGNNGADYIDGGSGGDEIFGNRLLDDLYGDSGNDYIDGGQEGASCDGGSGVNELVSCNLPI